MVNLFIFPLRDNIHTFVVYVLQIRNIANIHTELLQQFIYSWY